MKRKLIKQGSGEGLVVYLPREWIKTHSLISGDQVDIEGVNHNLVVSPSKDNSIKANKLEITLNFEIDNYKNIRMILKNYYNLGYTSFQITYNTPSIKEKIESIFENVLFGFEITKIDLENSTLRAEKYLSIDEKNANKLTNKLFFIFTDSLGELHQYYTLNNLESKKRILKNSVNIDKLESMIRRLIFTKENNDTEQNTNLWNLISYIIIADRSINKMLENCDISSSNNNDYISELLEIFKIFHKKIFLKDNFDHYHDYNIKIVNLQEKLLKDISSNILFNHFLIEIANYIYFMIAPVISIISVETLYIKNKND
jgi:hypothetical protein